jgi:hypothetical protein
MVTNINQLNLNKLYTYADYLLWQFSERIELLRGKIFKMSPAPNMRHQSISGRLFGELYVAFRDKKCRLFAAPFDVRLPQKGKADEQIYTVLQPDICVVCDPEKLDSRGCLGAPDLVIEILSPSNSQRDLKDKYELYQEAGVPEYWIVRPEERSITIYVLKDGLYSASRPVVEGEWVHSATFPALEIDTKTIFNDPITNDQ